MYKLKEDKEKIYIFYLIILFPGLILFQAPFFDSESYFILGDFQHTFTPKNYFYSYLLGFFENSNNGLGGTQTIRYTFELAHHFIVYFLDFLNIPLFLINRFVLYFYIFSILYIFYFYLEKKINSKISALIISLLIISSNPFLGNISLFMWASASGLILFFYFLEKIIEEKKLFYTLHLGLVTILFFNQLRFVIFLIYFVPIYLLLYYFIKKKFDFIFIIKAILLFGIVSFISNFITFFDYFNNLGSFLNLGWDEGDFKQTRIHHIYAYNLQNHNPYYFLRLIVNTFNPANEYLKLISIFRYFSIFLILIYLIGIFQLFKKDKLIFTINIFFLIFHILYTQLFFQELLISLPGLWTISSPYHIIYLSIPFFSVSYLYGFHLMSMKIRAILKSNFFFYYNLLIILIIFFINGPVTFFHRMQIDYKNYNLSLASSGYSNFIRFSDNNLKIINNLDKQKRILHLPLINDQYVYENTTKNKRAPLTLTFFSDLKLYYYYYSKLYTDEIFYKSFVKFDLNFIKLFFKNQNIEYVIINKKLIEAEKDKFLIPPIDLTNQKKISEDEDFIIYKINYTKIKKYN